MSFLSPLVLGGLAAVGVPVLIHLFNKFRVKKTDWGAMRFLLASVQKNQKRVKIDDLTLLIIRCLLIALAVIAFARPVMKTLGGAGEIRGPVASVVLLDQSASMGQRTGSLTRFDLAKNDIRTWLEGVDGRSMLGLYLASSRTTQLIGAPVNDLALFRKSLDEARLSDNGSELVTALRLAVESLKPITGRPKEIRIYTDGQAAAFRQQDEFLKIAEENPDVVIRPIIVGGKSENNLAVTQLQPQEDAAMGQPTRFLVEVGNFGDTAVTNLKVDLTVDDNVSAGSVVIPAIGAGETQSVLTKVNFETGGTHLLTAAITANDFAPDNRRVAAVEVAGRTEVLLAGQPLGDAERDQSIFFLSRGLVPVPRDQAPRYYLATVKGQMQDVMPAITQKPADRPNAVMLCDPGDVSQDLTAALDSYVKQGGNLVVFPGASTDNSRLSQSDFGNMLPGNLEAMVQVPAGATKNWQSSGFVHPITKFWNDAGNGSLGTVKFSRYCPLTVKGVGNATTVLSYADGQPAVAEWAYGKGSVVLFSASESQSWTNHPLHPSFVPFFQQLMGYFNHRSAARLTLAPGETFRKPLDDSYRGKDFSVQQPGMESARTAGQVVADGDNTYLRYAATQLVGSYQVLSSDEPLAKFVVQRDPLESDLRMVDPVLLKNLSEVKRKPAAGQARAISLKEYWTPILWIVAIFLLVEFVMAHRLSFVRRSA